MALVPQAAQQDVGVVMDAAGPVTGWQGCEATAQRLGVAAAVGVARNWPVLRLSRPSAEVAPRASFASTNKSAISSDQLRSAGDFTLSPRFAELAAGLVGVPGIRLYDQALFKEPGGGITPWHQDQGYWPLRGCVPVTKWIPLVDVTAEMGGSMSFTRGSCRRAREDLEILGWLPD